MALRDAVKSPDEKPAAAASPPAERLEPIAQGEPGPVEVELGY